MAVLCHAESVGGGSHSWIDGERWNMAASRKDGSKFRVRGPNCTSRTCFDAPWSDECNEPENVGERAERACKTRRERLRRADEDDEAVDFFLLGQPEPPLVGLSPVRCTRYLIRRGGEEPKVLAVTTDVALREVSAANDTPARHVPCRPWEVQTPQAGEEEQQTKRERSDGKRTRVVGQAPLWIGRARIYSEGHQGDDQVCIDTAR